ncbi:hypothetical protein FDT66_04430 [Polaribacter aestuariivivens]|uniref:ATPase AAA-type core domain-containing protein n=1 Tax=Polaribacter aestuariivivens TaxID=2304626 RepID=A0A5S3N8F3_9FLAO|nr:ATP-binding protein [Polaribacter aestuariivivens]TMM31222.1 hypothetical protein FDT66_04430 [Polaribacter aestuariivivens]
MNQFKLLCIIPLNGCDEKFRKNLTIGEAYKFKSDFTVELDDDKRKIIKISREKKGIENLYHLSNGISLEISALVGLNGSGKSALIELLYYLIYTMSLYNSKKPLLTEHSKLISQQIERAQKDSKKLYDSKKKFRSIELFKVLNDHNLNLSKKELAGITNGQTLIKNIIKKRLEFLLGQEQDDLKSERFIKENLSAAIVYETSGSIYSVSFSNKKLSCYKYDSNGKPKIIKDFFFDSFFYSICLNYSHHSLNSKVMGNWINSLFHKNDGYATPVVINPMRDNGNFDINRELHLSNERIMSNFAFDAVRNKKVRLLDKYELRKFLFSAKKDFTLIKLAGFQDKFEREKYSNTKYYDADDFDNLESVKLVRSILGKGYLREYSNYQDYALGYLEKKINKIKNNYSSLFDDKNFNFNYKKFISFLKNDKSHITKKLRQTINFLRVSDNKDSIWNKPFHYSYNELTLEELNLWLAECDKDFKNLTPSSLMDYALPGFFNIDFEISTSDNKLVKLSNLSSGEQQMIFNINTISYHLYNLQSVHFTDEDTEVIRLPYKNVAIILDEIEIYYHPDMQRELSLNIIEALEKVKNTNDIGIESIHIIYLTHSPFILSDIPSSNILRLNNGQIKELEQQTFGANIHDLLANDFFLEKGFMGEFAKNEINKVIESLNFKRLNNLKDEKQKLINKTIDTDKRLILENEIIKIENKLNNIATPSKKYDETYCKKLIELVGEPILYMSLMELYTEVFQSKKEEFIQSQIDRLEKLKKL